MANEYFSKTATTQATDQHLRGGEPLAVLPEGHYHAVVFSLLLEYLPTPEQRLLCVEKARDVLADNGVLFVITPRSTAKKNTAHKIKGVCATPGH
jgi:hypothetical protein